MNELVFAYRDGDIRAFVPVYLALGSFCGWMAKCYGDQQTYSREDVLGDCDEVIALAVLDWDPAKGYKYFYHYVKQMAKWKVTARRYVQINRRAIAPIYLDLEVGRRDVDPRDSTAVLEAREFLSRAYERATPAVLEMLDLKASGLSNVQTGARLGCSNQWVSTCLRRLASDIDLAA